MGADRSVGMVSSAASAIAAPMATSSPSRPSPSLASSVSHPHAHQLSTISVGVFNAGCCVIFLLLALWAARIVYTALQHFETLTKLPHVRVLELSGMSIYQRDMRQLVKMHLKQILRMRYKQPSVPLQRWNVADHADPGAASFQISNQSVVFRIRVRSSCSRGETVAVAAELLLGVKAEECQKLARSTAGPHEEFEMPGAPRSTFDHVDARYRSGVQEFNIPATPAPSFTYSSKELTFTVPAVDLDMVRQRRVPVLLLLRRKEVQVNISNTRTATEEQEQDRNDNASSGGLGLEDVCQPVSDVIVQGSPRSRSTSASTSSSARPAFSPAARAPLIRPRGTSDRPLIFNKTHQPQQQRCPGGAVVHSAMQASMWKIGPVPARVEDNSTTPVSLSLELVRQMVFEGGQGVELAPIYGFEGGEDDSECMICYERVKNSMLLPCRHCSACTTCLRSLREEKCPLCRTAFDKHVSFPTMKKRRRAARGGGTAEDGDEGGPPPDGEGGPGRGGRRGPGGGRGGGNDDENDNDNDEEVEGDSTSSPDEEGSGGEGGETHGESGGAPPPTAHADGSRGARSNKNSSKGSKVADHNDHYMRLAAGEQPAPSATEDALGPEDPPAAVSSGRVGAPPRRKKMRKLNADTGSTLLVNAAAARELVDFAGGTVSVSAARPQYPLSSGGASAAGRELVTQTQQQRASLRTEMESPISSGMTGVRALFQAMVGGRRTAAQTQPLLEPAGAAATMLTPPGGGTAGLLGPVNPNQGAE